MDTKRVLKCMDVISEHAQAFTAANADFDAEYRALCAKDSGLIGRFLVSHLILEHHLLDYLATVYHSLPFADARLEFMQKCTLALKSGTAFNCERAMYETAVCLNKIRNKMVHDLQYTPDKAEKATIVKLTKYWAKHNKTNPNKDSSFADAVEFITRSTCEVMGFYTHWVKQYGEGKGLEEVDKRFKVFRRALQQFRKAVTAELLPTGTKQAKGKRYRWYR